jgi:hypothetical protein
MCLAKQANLLTIFLGKMNHAGISVRIDLSSGLEAIAQETRFLAGG